METADNLFFEPDLAPAKATKPPNRWVNWYQLTRDVYWMIQGGPKKVGDIWSGLTLWPSEEIAEQKAAEQMREYFARRGFTYVDYLGAYPEGERP